MNKKDRNPDYDGLYREAVRLFRRVRTFSSGALDETYYTMRVYETAKEIILRLLKPVHRQRILVAALLHDIGKTKLDVKKIHDEKGFTDEIKPEWKRHPKLSVPMARRILKRMRHSDSFIDGVCYLIENHSNKSAEPMTLELKILQDADLIADCGVAGFIRPFSFGGFFKRPTIGSIMFIQKNKSRIENLDEIHLNVSKKLARRELRLEKDLVRMAGKTIRSSVVQNVFKLP
jgi:HD superfamily phosphodiesterase